MSEHPPTGDPIPQNTATSVRDPEEQRLLEHELRQLFEHKISFNEFLGFEVELISAQQVCIGFDMRTEMIGHYLHGRLHGGVISAVLDATGGMAVMCSIAERFSAETAAETMQRFTHLGTIDLRVDFLRQGIGNRFQAKSQVLRLGRRIAATQMQLCNEQGTLIATGSATYIVS